MNQVITPEIKEVVQAVHYRPAVSIIMPFEPKMSAKTEITQNLKLAIDKVEREIKQKYPDQLGRLVMHKLKKIIKELNFSTYKKSIAIYVSPVFEKVLYLDIPVEEKIIIDESFEIRDLVYAKKEIHKYLVVVLSAKHCKVYIGNTNTFVKIKSGVPDHTAAFIPDSPERLANFSDPSERKETILKKFLHETDKGLGFLLNTYQLPVFVMGAKKVLGYFKSTSDHEKNIAGYIHGNYEDATEDELKNILKPYVSDWKKLKIKDLLQQIENAAGAGKLSRGIQEVWKQASHKKGRLLIVEKNFMYAAEHGKNEETIYGTSESYNEWSYIKDAVDDVIEKVLEYGGDIEFVDEGLLNDYQHIAMIQYY